MNRNKNPHPDSWEERISREAKRLERRQPSGALWSLIEARLKAAIEESRASTAERARSDRRQKMPGWIFHPFEGLRGWRWTGPVVTLASAAVVVSAAWMFRERLPLPWIQPANRLSRIEKDVASTERRYEALIERLTPLARQNESNLDPRLLALYQEKLALLDESIRECRSALAANRGNSTVQMALLSNYRDKLKTLHAIIQMKS